MKHFDVLQAFLLPGYWHSPLTCFVALFFATSLVMVRKTGNKVSFDTVFYPLMTLKGQSVSQIF